MGNCVVKQKKHTYPSSLKVQVPDLSYLSRKSKYLLSVTSQEVSLINLKPALRIYPNSSISILSNKSIIIGGGSDSSLTLTSQVFLINPNENSVSELPSAPIPFKNGHFLEYQNYIYHLGGYSESNDPSSPFSEEGSALMRLNLLSSSWEIFKDSSAYSPGLSLQRQITSPDPQNLKDAWDFKLKSILEPAVVLIGSKIYLICGKICVNSKTQVTNRVFSIEIEGKFEVAEEMFRMPVALSAAQACADEKIAVVAGGYLENTADNLDIFLINVEAGTVRKLELRVDRPIEKGYPICADAKGLLCFSPPKLLYVREDKKKVFTFTMPAGENLKVAEAREIKRIETDGEVRKIEEDLSVKTVEEWWRNEDDVHFTMVDEEIPNNVNENLFKYSFSLKSNNLKLEDSRLVQNEPKEPEETCENGHLMRKSQDPSTGYCIVCQETKQGTYYCPNCEISICSQCIKYLKTYTRLINPNIKCRKNHYFSSPKSPTEDLTKCCNCKLLAKSFKFCFHCKKSLCQCCLTNLTLYSTLLQKCSLSHPLTYCLNTKSISEPAKICAKCCRSPSGICCFCCRKCEIVVCQACVAEQSPKSLKASGINCFQERPTLLNEGFKRIEMNLGDDFKTGNKKKMNDKDKVKKVEVFIEEPEVSKKIEVGTLEDFKSKVIQRPRRADAVPELVLALSPSKPAIQSAKNSHCTLKNIIKREILYTPSPKQHKLYEIPQKSLSDSLDEPFAPNPMENGHQQVPKLILITEQSDQYSPHPIIAMSPRVTGVSQEQSFDSFQSEIVEERLDQVVVESEELCRYSSRGSYQQREEFSGQENCEEVQAKDQMSEEDSKSREIADGEVKDADEESGEHEEYIAPRVGNTLGAGMLKALMLKLKSGSEEAAETLDQVDFLDKVHIRTPSSVRRSSKLGDSFISSDTSYEIQ